MAKRAAGLPRPKAAVLRKSDLLRLLAMIDKDEAARARILRLETAFRSRISTHLEALPVEDATLQKFNTSPFVLLFHSFHKGYTRISQIESDILPAKLFSSMETSAGRMIEAVMLPEYGWECVQSTMHSANSALDGKRRDDDVLRLATLKSGPRCLNDEMSENFADAIINNCEAWATEAGVHQIDFSYGVLYGTKKTSNKKDWHILRNIREKVGPKDVIVQPDNRWNCSFQKAGINISVSIRIGADWWNYLGGDACSLEMCISLIRACIRPGDLDPVEHLYSISDLAKIVADRAPADYNVGILQASQRPWLFFIASHFCDDLVE